MNNFVYLDEKYYEYLKNYPELDGPTIIEVKEYLKNIVKELIPSPLGSNFTIYIEKLEHNNKIKVFADDYIYVLTMSNQINNKYTIWYKKKTKIC